MTWIFLGLFILLLILVAFAAVKVPNKVIKGMIHILGGVVGLWLGNLLLSVFSWEVPMNAFTIGLVALLGFPGVLALTILQILGI